MESQKDLIAQQVSRVVHGASHLYQTISLGLFVIWNIKKCGERSKHIMKTKGSLRLGKDFEPIMLSA